MVLSVIVASFSQILLKVGANKKYDSIKKEYLNRYVVIFIHFAHDLGIYKDCIH